MTPTILALTVILFAADPTPTQDAKPMRKPHPLAPSLTELTAEEEDKLDEIINRFIKADTGQTTGDEAKQARREFEALGPDAIPAMLRGLNRAAKLDHSCPTILIAKRLSILLATSEDQKLLDFARDEIGTGVPRNKHAGILAQLRTQCLLRMNMLARTRPPAPRPATSTLTTMSNADLVKAASSESGPKLKPILIELEQRKGPEVLPALSGITSSKDTDTQQLARGLLDKHMARQPGEFIKEKMKASDSEVRRSALRTAAKLPGMLGDLIDALADEQSDVREEAHKGLLKWSKGEDYGPAADADKALREESQTKWRSWLAKRKEGTY